MILASLIGNAYNLPDGFKEQKNGIAFTENKGQVHDQNNNPRPDVLFGAMSFFNEITPYDSTIVC